MYNTLYNHQIANELDRINQAYIAHNLHLAGSGHATGQKKYKKQGPTHYEGSGIFDYGKYVFDNPLLKKADKIIGNANLVKDALSNFVQGFRGSGVSGSGVSGSGRFDVKRWLGFGKPTKKQLKALEGAGGFNLAGPMGMGFGVGWGKRKPTKKQLDAMEGAGGFNLAGPMGMGFGVGWGKKGKKRGNPNLSKRAEVVKQVMKEQGLSMIEASKYVKAHNLY